MAATATAIAAGPGPDERALFEETMRSDARTVPLRSPEVPLRYVAPWTRSRAGSPGPTTMASRTRCTLSHRTWLQNACPAAPPSRRSGGMARRWTHVRHGARAEVRQAGVVHPQDLQPHGGEADSRRHQRLGITGASCPGTVERRMANHASQPVGRRRPEVPGRAPRRDPVGSQPARRRRGRAARRTPH